MASFNNARFWATGLANQKEQEKSEFSLRKIRLNNGLIT